MMSVEPGQMKAITASAGAIADGLSHEPELEGREVVDETGLKDRYDFTLHWTADQTQTATFEHPADGSTGVGDKSPTESSGPSLFTAIQEQPGLKLESKTAPVQILVIDHIERPSEN
jgi:uncharacterized protein (TIGR03435 family)